MWPSKSLPVKVNFEVPLHGTYNIVEVEGRPPEKGVLTELTKYVEVENVGALLMIDPVIE